MALVHLPKADHYVVSLSGGRDSSALAVWTARQKLHCQYVFCDTKTELPEVYDYLIKLENALGISIIRLESEGFEKRLVKQNFHWPTVHTRWCVGDLKIKPLHLWFSQFEGTICNLVGTRFDERRLKPVVKVGGQGEIVTQPFRDLGYGLADVRQILSEAGIGEPEFYRWKRRSGCWCCPFQGLSDWRGLLKYHPELFAKAEEWERVINNRLKQGRQRHRFTLYYGKIPLNEIRSQMEFSFA